MALYAGFTADQTGPLATPPLVTPAIPTYPLEPLDYALQTPYKVYVSLANYQGQRNNRADIAEYRLRHRARRLLLGQRQSQAELGS